jgi:hypothetical protein
MNQFEYTRILVYPARANIIKTPQLVKFINRLVVLSTKGVEEEAELLSPVLLAILYLKLVFF